MDAHVLIVDDDRLLREVIADFLLANGYRVSTAENASIALAKFNVGEYQLAIVDQTMPGMSGLELMAKLMEQDPDIYCLIMTGYPTIDLVYNTVIEGKSSYIIKPFQLMELLNIVQKILTR
ncbi:MAG: response regulator [Candidatus Cloacimonadaceae bacterium]